MIVRGNCEMILHICQNIKEKIGRKKQKNLKSWVNITIRKSMNRKYQIRLEQCS